MMHDIELLQYVYKTADMGCDGIDSVTGHTQNAALENELQKQYSEYKKLRGEARTLLEGRNEFPKGVGAIAKASADVMAVSKMMVDHTDSKITEMSIQGNQMGINKTIKHLHDYNGQDTEVRSLAEKLLATEEANAEQLKRFL